MARKDDDGPPVTPRTAALWRVAWARWVRWLAIVAGIALVAFAAEAAGGGALGAAPPGARAARVVRVELDPAVAERWAAAQRHAANFVLVRGLRRDQIRDASNPAERVASAGEEEAAAALTIVRRPRKAGATDPADAAAAAEEAAPEPEESAEAVGGAEDNAESSESSDSTRLADATLAEADQPATVGATPPVVVRRSRHKRSRPAARAEAAAGGADATVGPEGGKQARDTGRADLGADAGEVVDPEAEAKARADAEAVAQRRAEAREAKRQKRIAAAQARAETAAAQAVAEGQSGGGEQAEASGVVTEAAVQDAVLGPHEMPPLDLKVSPLVTSRDAEDALAELRAHTEALTERVQASLRNNNQESSSTSTLLKLQEGRAELDRLLSIDPSELGGAHDADSPPTERNEQASGETRDAQGVEQE